jgi:hypothetical protein
MSKRSGKSQFSNVLVVLVAILLIVGGTAHAYKKIKCFVLQPPEQVLPEVRTIAILDFSGRSDAGKQITDYMISELIKSDRGIYTIEGGLFSKGREGVTFLDGATTAILSVAERSRLDQVMSEQVLSMSGAVDDNQAASIGQVLGVDAIITGSVTFSHNDTQTKETREYYRNKQKYTVVVDCLTRKAVADSRMRILDVNTGQILGVKEAKKELEDKKCGDDRQNIATAEAMTDACIRSVAGQLVSYFNPYFTLSEWEFEKVKAKEFKDKADDAAEQAEKGNLDNAYAVYYALSQEDAYNDQLHYNLGILNEVYGNFSPALDEYKMAYELKTEKRYEEAVKRTQKQVDFWQDLNKLGINLAAHEFGTSEAELQKAMAVKVEVKGGSGDRIEVKAGTSNEAETVAKVPGGIQLEVISDEGEWIKVKLLGGKEGYLPRDKVKM